VWMGWGVYSEISSGVVWVRSVGVLSCVILHLTSITAFYYVVLTVSFDIYR